MPNQVLAHNLYLLRKSHHLTQDDLGRILNVSRQAYSNYETGNRNPDLDSLICLANFYQITLDNLVLHDITPDV